jgi:recombinational DNA repair protein RecR
VFYLDEYTMASSNHAEAAVTVNLLDCMHCHVQLTRCDVTLKDGREATTLAIVNTPEQQQVHEKAEPLLGLHGLETGDRARK